MSAAVKTPAMMATVSPNKPKTPVSNFRIPPRVKEAARAKAEAEGRTLTEVIVKALEDYAAEEVAG